MLITEYELLHLAFEKIKKGRYHLKWTRILFECGWRACTIIMRILKISALKEAFQLADIENGEVMAALNT